MDQTGCPIKLVVLEGFVAFHGEFLKTLKAVKQSYQTGQFEEVKNWWKMPKLTNSNATFWVIFKHCESVEYYLKHIRFRGRIILFRDR